MAELAEAEAAEMKVAETGVAEPVEAEAADMVLDSLEGVPLTITPSLEKHRPDAWVVREMGWNGIEPKAMARI